LALNYADNYELIFDIGDDLIIFIGSKTDGLFTEEGPVNAGTVFKMGSGQFVGAKYFRVIFEDKIV
jgi:hypothetical protein